MERASSLSKVADQDVHNELNTKFDNLTFNSRMKSFTLLTFIKQDGSSPLQCHSKVWVRQGSDGSDNVQTEFERNSPRGCLSRSKSVRNTRSCLRTSSTDRLREELNTIKDPGWSGGKQGQWGDRRERPDKDEEHPTSHGKWGSWVDINGFTGPNHKKYPRSLMISAKEKP